MRVDRLAESPDEMTVRDWKTSLVNYSMAKAEPEDCISVHALVQAVERHAMSGEIARKQPPREPAVRRAFSRE